MNLASIGKGRGGVTAAENCIFIRVAAGKMSVMIALQDGTTLLWGRTKKKGCHLLGIEGSTEWPRAYSVHDVYLLVVAADILIAACDFLGNPNICNQCLYWRTLAVAMKSCSSSR